jgi:hypothetical protein
MLNALQSDLEVVEPEVEMAHFHLGFSFSFSCISPFGS